MVISPSLQWITQLEGTSEFQPDPFHIAFHFSMVPLKVIFVRLVQFLKAPEPIPVTLSGIVTLVKFL